MMMCKREMIPGGRGQGTLQGRSRLLPDQPPPKQSLALDINVISHQRMGVWVRSMQWKYLRSVRVYAL